MSISEFWLQSNNGKSYNLNNLKNIKEEDVAKNPKLQRLIKLFDIDGQNGVEVKNSKEVNEWESIFKELVEASNGDNKLTEIEFEDYISKKLADKNIKDIHFTQNDLNELLDLADETVDKKQFDDTVVYLRNGVIDSATKINDNGKIEHYVYQKTDEGYEITKNEQSAYETADKKILQNINVITYTVSNIDEKGNFKPEDILYKMEYKAELTATPKTDEQQDVEEQKEKPELKNGYVVTYYNNGKISQIILLDKDQKEKSRASFIYKDGKVIKLERKDGIETKIVAESIDENGTLQGITERYTRHSDGKGTAIRFADNKQTVTKVKNMSVSFEYKTSDIIEEKVTELGDEEAETDKTTDNKELQTILEYMTHPGGGELKYNSKTIKDMFEALGKEGSEYVKISDSPLKFAKKNSDGSISQTITLDDSLSTIEYGTALKTTKADKEYVITYQDAKAEQKEINKYYHFVTNGNFKYVVITNDKKPDIRNIVYPTGEMDIVETKDGKQSGMVRFDKDNNQIFTKGYEWDENGRILYTSTIYTEHASKDVRNTKINAMNDGTMYYYKKGKDDKDGEFSVLNKMRVCDSAPILNEKNEIVGYQPITTMLIGSNGRAQDTKVYTRATLEKQLEKGQHFDYSKINNELRATAANNLIQMLENTIFMLEEKKKGKSFADASVYLDKIIGESIDDSIARLKKMKEDAEMLLLTVHKSNEELESLSKNEHLSDELTFGTIYYNLTGRNWDDNEKDKYQKFNQTTSKISTNLSAIYNEYIKNGSLKESSKALFNKYSQDKEFDETKFNDFIQQAEATRENLAYSYLYEASTGKEWEGEEWDKDPKITKKCQELCKLADEYLKNNKTLTDDLKTKVSKILGKKDCTDEDIEKCLGSAGYVPLTGTVVGYDMYTQTSKELLKQSEVQKAINTINTDQANNEDFAIVLDIAATAGEFKLISLGISAVGKLLSAGVRFASKVDKVGKTVKLSKQLLESEKLAGTVQFVKQESISAMNFMAYDVSREFGRQKYNDEELNTDKLAEAALHGTEMGLMAPAVSSALRWTKGKFGYRYTANREKITQEIEKYRLKCIKQGKTPDIRKINEIRQEMMAAPTWQSDKAGFISGIAEEAGTFGTATAIVQMFDSLEIREQIREARKGNPALEKLSDEDIENMSKTDMMRAMLEMQGHDTSGWSDVELYGKYAYFEYISQLQNIAQLKIGDYIIGSIFTKGKAHTGVSGARTKALEKDLTLNKKGEWCLKSKPGETFDDAQVLNMTEQAAIFDALDSRLQNRFNKYKDKPMSAEQFVEMCHGAQIKAKDVSGNSQLGMTIIPKDGKYEVTTKDGQKTTVDDVEGILDILKIEEIKYIIEASINQQIQELQIPVEQQEAYRKLARMQAGLESISSTTTTPAKKAKTETKPLDIRISELDMTEQDSKKLTRTIRELQEAINKLHETNPEEAEKLQEQLNNKVKGVNAGSEPIHPAAQSVEKGVTEGGNKSTNDKTEPSPQPSPEGRGRDAAKPAKSGEHSAATYTQRSASALHAQSAGSVHPMHDVHEDLVKNYSKNSDADVLNKMKELLEKSENQDYNDENDIYVKYIRTCDKLFDVKNHDEYENILKELGDIMNEIERLMNDAENTEFDINNIFAVSEYQQLVLSKVDNRIRIKGEDTVDTIPATSSARIRVDNMPIVQGQNGLISLSDAHGTALGQVSYALKEVNGEKVLTFEGLESHVQGQGIGSRLILELINESKKLGAKGRLSATASPMKASDGKVQTNIEFYYKLGFKAVDPKVDEQVRTCIENGKPIPMSLCVFTPIELSKDAAQSFERKARIEILDKYKNIDSPKGKELDKALDDLHQIVIKQEDIRAKVQEIQAGLQELVKINPEEAESLTLVLNILTGGKTGAEATCEEIGAFVQHNRRQYELEHNKISNELAKYTSDLIEISEKPESGKTIATRLKSDTSMFDKIANYALQNPDRPFTEALNDVRDTIGFRFVLKSEDAKKLPAVQTLVDAKKPNAAFAEGLKEYSAIAQKVITNLMQSKLFEIYRVSNLHDKNGHSIIDKDLEVLRYKADKDGEEPIVVEDVKINYKAQKSCYPALQVNLRTPDGKIIEIQIRFDTVDEYAEFEHLIYDLMTDKDIIGRHPELEPLFKPLSNILDKMPKEEYDNSYIKYTQDQYHYRFMKALGINIKEPKFEDYKDSKGQSFDPRLSAENLKKLHDLAEDVKKKRKTPEAAVEEYNRAVEKSTIQKTVNKSAQAKQKENPVNTEVDDNVNEFVSLTSALKDSNTSYQITNDNDGNQIIRTVSERTKKSNGGIEFKYDVYKFDKDGNLTEEFKNQTEKEVRSKFGKDWKIADNSAFSTSGNLNSTIVPIPSVLKRRAKVWKYLREHFTYSNSEHKKACRKALNHMLKLNENIDFSYSNELTTFVSSYVHTQEHRPQQIQMIDKFIQKYNNPRILSIVEKIMTQTSFAKNKEFQNEINNFTEAILNSNLTDTEVDSILNSGLHPIKAIDNYNEALITPKIIKTLTKILPEIKGLPEDVLKNMKTIVEKSLYKSEAENTLLQDKQKLLDVIEQIPTDIKQKMEEKGCPILKLEQNFKSSIQLTGYDVKTDKISQNRFLKSIIANNNPDTEAILLGENFTNFLNKNKNQGLTLKYSRQGFVRAINSSLSTLPEEVKNDVLKHLNITITEKDFAGFLKLDEFDFNKFDKSYHSQIKDIQAKVRAFVKENEIICPDKEIKAILDDLLQGFPEFASICGMQDGDNPNKLEIHILQTLNLAMKYPEYNKLNDSDKTVLKFAILLHDIGKRAGIGDRGQHASQSATYARSILDKLQLGQEEKERIVNLVRHHHWASTESDKNNFGYYFRTKGDAEVAKIMAQADYEARFNNKIDVSEYDSKIGSVTKPIVDHNTKGIEKFPKVLYTIDGEDVQIPVLRLADLTPETDMFDYGYNTHIKLKDIIIQRHNCKTARELENIIQNYYDPNYDMDLSTGIYKLDSKQNGYGGYALALSTTRMNTGKISKDLQGSLDKKGFEKFVISLSKTNNSGYLSRKNFEDIVELNNETQSLNPKPELIIVHGGCASDKLPDEIVRLYIKYHIPIIIQG